MSLRHEGWKSNEGVEMSDGGTILYPELDGLIVRIDHHGHRVQSWYPGDADYETYNNLMGDRKWKGEEE